MSKAYAVGANFDSADFTNAVLDRVAFNGADPAAARPCVDGVYCAQAPEAEQRPPARVQARACVRRCSATRWLRAASLRARTSPAPSSKMCSSVRTSRVSVGEWAVVLSSPATTSVCIQPLPLMCEHRPRGPEAPVCQRHGNGRNAPSGRLPRLAAACLQARRGSGAYSVRTSVQTQHVPCPHSSLQPRTAATASAGAPPSR